MKVSLITVVCNGIATIESTIRSINNQTYADIETIVVDGNSTDGTVEWIVSNKNKISGYISEPDDGIYNAMNKGIKLATGDIIGLLNADDFLNNNSVIEEIVNAFSDQNVDAVYGDVLFVNPGNLNKVVRYYSSKGFSPRKFKYGFMPAHPSFYVKRELFEKYGYYKEDYTIAADFELLLRFMHNHKIRCRYIEMPIVTMRTGGISNNSLKSRFILNKEIIRACRENGIKTNNLMVYSKYLTKIFELFGNQQVYE